MTSPAVQSGFDGFSPPVASDRLFLALFPDAQTATRIATLAASECERHGLCAKQLRADRLHVTLFHLGDWSGVPADLVAATRQAVDALRDTPFEAVFDTVASFAARRVQKPFVLKGSSGNEALRAFHARLADALDRNGLAKWTRGSYEPHATLAYDSIVVSPQAVEPVSWTVSECVLVHSLLGQTKHVPLACWSFAP